jgi:hypothetical protein
MIENANDLADPKNAAAAYMKLQDDVKLMILETVAHELQTDTYGTLSSQIRQLVRNEIRNELQNYRITYQGTTANY